MALTDLLNNVKGYVFSMSAGCFASFMYNQACALSTHEPIDPARIMGMDSLYTIALFSYAASTYLLVTTLESSFASQTKT